MDAIYLTWMAEVSDDAGPAGTPPVNNALARLAGKHTLFVVLSVDSLVISFWAQFSDLLVTIYMGKYIYRPIHTRSLKKIMRRANLILAEIRLVAASGVSNQPDTSQQVPQPAVSLLEVLERG